MPDTFLSFIFPAFTRGYPDHPGESLPGFKEYFSSFLHAGARVVDPGLAGFSFTGPTFLDDELRTQYITYIYSCAASVALRKCDVIPALTAGYSMGIYAAMFDAGVVPFETGLELIHIAYHSLTGSLKEDRFGMGSLIGLDREDIGRLIRKASLKVEITNQNASHSFVFSGSRDDVAKLLEMAREDGALHVRDLGVSVPYHSRYLEPGTMEFAGKISRIGFSEPGNGIVSLIDQEILNSGESMRAEAIRNLYHALNWLTTQQKMMERNISVFVETGPSSGLVRNAKFVEGSYRFYTAGNILEK